MCDLKLDSAYLLRLIKTKFGWDRGQYVARHHYHHCHNLNQQHLSKISKITKSKGFVYQRSHYHHHHYNRCFEFVRERADYKKTEQEAELKPLENAEKELTSAVNTANILKKAGNNYTINIYYNNPKKQQQEHQQLQQHQQQQDSIIRLVREQKEITRDRLNLLEEARTTMKESTDAMAEQHYDEALRHVLLLHLLKDRTFLENSFKRFLEEDLKDMNPERVRLLKDYLLERPRAFKGDSYASEASNPSSALEENKLAFVKEALDLCDKIINESTTDEGNESERKGKGTEIEGTSQDMFRSASTKETEYENETNQDQKIAKYDDKTNAMGEERIMYDGGDREDAIRNVSNLKRGLSDDELAAIYKATGKQFVGHKDGVVKMRRKLQREDIAEEQEAEDEEEGKMEERRPEHNRYSKNYEQKEAEEDSEVQETSGKRFRLRRATCRRRGSPVNNLQVGPEEANIETTPIGNIVYDVGTSQIKQQQIKTDGEEATKKGDGKEEVTYIVNVEENDAKMEEGDSKTTQGDANAKREAAGIANRTKII